MKVFKQSISIFLVAVFMISFANFNAFAEEIDYWEYDRLIHSAEYFFEPIEETVLYESDDYAKYAYIVKDGEASIVNIHATYQGDEKIDLVLPTTLGGYPVTSIGYEYDNTGIDTTWYIHYGEDPFEKHPEYLEEMYYPEWDPGLNYVSRIVIPEGYKYIYSRSLIGAYYISFPKSLRKISGVPFESVHTSGVYSMLNLVLPECNIECSPELRDAFAFARSNEYITLPSRIVENSANWLYLLRSGPNLYVPSNISVEDFSNTLYYYEAAAGDAGEIWPRQDADCTVHCAPDSEFLSVFEEYGEHPYATIITDVTPAEYIEFPEDTVNVQVGDVVDLEAKTYPAEAVWTACNYEVSDPSIVSIDDYSGRITALKEGTVTVTATHCERGFVDTCTVNVTTEPEPVSGVNEIKPATDTPYFAYGNRDYQLELTGSPSKIQVVRKNGTTTTIDRSKATVTSNGDTETWVVNMRVEAGEHAIRAKYGKVWDEKTVPFTVTYDTPKAYSFDIAYEKGIATFEVVTDTPITKVQFLLDNGNTLTYTQSNSYIGEDGLRHWTVTRKASAGTNYTLKTKLGYIWTTTELTAST